MPFWQALDGSPAPDGVGQRRQRGFRTRVTSRCEAAWARPQPSIFVRSATPRQMSRMRREQVQPVAADDLVVGVDLDGVEEGVDRPAQPRHRRHGRFEVFRLHRRRDRRLGRVEGREQRRLGRVLGEFRVRPVGSIRPRPPPRPGSRMLLARLKPWIRLSPSSVSSTCRQRLGPLDQQGEVVVVRHGEAGVDHVVADALGRAGGP